MFTLSIAEPLTDVSRLQSVFDSTGFWLEDSGALVIEDLSTGGLLGTTQFYRSGACIHGYEIGYVLHDEADWGKGFGSDALRLMSQAVLDTHPDCFRLQLIIETWNDASWHLAERCGYQREGTMRMAGYSSVVRKTATSTRWYAMCRLKRTNARWRGGRGVCGRSHRSSLPDRTT